MKNLNINTSAASGQMNAGNTNYEFGNEMISTSGLANNANIGQSVQSYYQGSGQLTNTAGLANNTNVGAVSTTGLQSSEASELSDYQMS